MRRAAKRDAIEPAIVEVLERCGWTVTPISIPHGPDLIAGKNGITELIENKTGNRSLKAGQRAWHSWWKGRAVIVLRSVEDAVRFSGAR